MAIINGPRQLIDTAIPTGVSATYLMRFEMQEGMNAEEVIALAATKIGEANEWLVSTYGGLIFLTEKAYASYGLGGDPGMTPKGSEYAEEDGQVSEGIGHMLHAEDYKDATAWSADYLMRAVREDITRDVELKKVRWINRIDYDVLTAMFRSTEIAVGSAGWSVPWAIGTGMNVNFVPQSWMGTNFDSTHTHFIRINAAASAANVQTTIESMSEHLAHHGHTGLKVLYVSSSIATLILSINDTKKFATFISPEFRLLSGNTNIPVSYVPGQMEGIPGEIIGYYSTNNGLVEIRKHPRVPAGYMWMGKSYGSNDLRNPMAVRVWKNEGFGLKVRPQISRDINPMLEKVLFKGTHGVNVNDRTAGVAAQIASGGASYDEPTIT
jgi:hypothetical protein